MRLCSLETCHRAAFPTRHFPPGASNNSAGTAGRIPRRRGRSRARGRGRAARRRDGRPLRSLRALQTPGQLRRGRNAVGARARGRERAAGTSASFPRLWIFRLGWSPGGGRRCGDEAPAAGPRCSSWSVPVPARGAFTRIGERLGGAEGLSEAGGEPVAGRGPQPGRSRAPPRLPLFLAACARARAEPASPGRCPGASSGTGGRLGALRGQRERRQLAGRRERGRFVPSCSRPDFAESCRCCQKKKEKVSAMCGLGGRLQRPSPAPGAASPGRAERWLRRRPGSSRRGRAGDGHLGRLCPRLQRGREAGARGRRAGAETHRLGARRRCSAAPAPLRPP
ncbi:uncharacterized protein LOC134152558 [Rhea pennata]|uniref:uncharacterized protein LOC134152558 n=1 Tax=Rhea pennata TaxID=8795 RepID=UPI002E266F73